MRAYADTLDPEAGEALMQADLRALLAEIERLRRVEEAARAVSKGARLFTMNSWLLSDDQYEALRSALPPTHGEIKG